MDGHKLITEGSQRGHRSCLQSYNFSTPSTFRAEEINTQYTEIRLDLKKNWQREQESSEEVTVLGKDYLISPSSQALGCIAPG